MKILSAEMTPVTGPVQASGGVDGSGSIFLINNNTDSALITLRYRYPAQMFEAAEGQFEASATSSTRWLLHRDEYFVRRPRQGSHRARCPRLVR